VSHKRAAAKPTYSPFARVRNYCPIFKQCHNALNQTRLAIRRMSVDAENLLLMVNPSTLETSLEHERCWTCADTDDETQKETRLIRRGSNVLASSCQRWRSAIGRF
jgi:hypothetical protein